MVVFGSGIFGSPEWPRFSESRRVCVSSGSLLQTGQGEAVSGGGACSASWIVLLPLYFVAHYYVIAMKVLSSSLASLEIMPESLPPKQRGPFLTIAA